MSDGIDILYRVAVTVPTIGLPFQEITVPLTELGPYFKHANQCFFGTDSLSTDNCSEFGIPVVVFLAYIVFNVVYNQLLLIVFRDGSSVLAVVASAARLPLVNVLLMVQVISGGAQQGFTLHDGFALAILVVSKLSFCCAFLDIRTLVAHVLGVPENLIPKVSNCILFSGVCMPVLATVF